ncbi:LysR family transcriptional regulator [Roseobacter sp. HKCCD9010]|uniref:LysR substrate-binding domain-containing protein n=1 Tax=unclassified Roseobacter TaxID=196798 RepID=UPI001491FF9A|nr:MULTISPECIES: LysR substrate-binding domain-containing protein [unclassified Roseobacter]MBF9051428.1 LysR family transcriptional regulator [Rhodobacterales bacterium HKCCD4356]NNV13475.1 LysR family transcriptional regulator [Roseobacter sp. HKCCD7357]NNV17726.1 LysR family transcriptional regulator [Roseobacter sp. HKCCD8768]NNV27332.1 LysR family transcriptional regulator [Roseobacter sp. HKCCD8192]NNV31452.1 LysR family transcriptional regulator [Roseobacter sp. HKCCD9061]
MQTRSPNLTWLRSFEAAARLLNFTEAGRELGLTQTAISLHIKSLEATLGCQLFIRKARHLSLSAMGQAYLHSVSEALANIDLATTSLFGPLARQTITVRAPISTAALWLGPHLPAFTKAHPGISVRLISTIWATSISDEEVDVDIRQGVGHWPGLEVEQISTESIVPIRPKTSPVVQVGDPAFQDMPLIQILGYEDMWDRYLSAHGLEALTSKPALIVDTTAVAIAMVAAGGGHAAIQTRFATSAIAAGMDISIAEDPAPFHQSHFLIRRKTQRQQRPEVEIFREWLRSIFSDTAPGPVL